MPFETIEHFEPHNPQRPELDGRVTYYAGRQIEEAERHYYAIIGATHLTFVARPTQLSKRLREVATLLIECDPTQILEKRNVYVHAVRYHGNPEGGFLVFTDTFGREHVRTPGDLLHSNGGY